MSASELINFLEQIFDSWGYLIVFLSSFIEITPLGWTIPGGLFLALGGFFAYSQKLSLLVILVFSWFGAWLTFILAYLLGYKTGDFLVKRLRQEKTAKQAEILLRKHGAVILTTSMLASITRFWVAYIAGVQKYNKVKFITYSAIASLTWSSLMVVLGYFAGSERSRLESSLSRIGLIGWGLVILALSIIYWTIRKEKKELAEPQ